MVFATPFGNLKGFATSRPPLMVFTLCLIAFAITTLSLAYFIKHSETLRNPDVHVDWSLFLKHLSSFDLCVLPDDTLRITGNSSRPDEVDLNDNFGNISISVSASLSLVHQLQLSTLPHNVTVAAGVLPITGWTSSCKTEPETTSLNISLVLPQNLSHTDDVCVTFVGPRSLLPIPSSPSTCAPMQQGGATAKLIGRSRDAEVLGERENDDWCRGGTVMRMAYRSDPHLTVMLTGLPFTCWCEFDCNYCDLELEFYVFSFHTIFLLFALFLERDRSVINLHLVHTSYFLFVMAMTLVCYALIKGKPKQAKVILIDKIPLDP